MSPILTHRLARPKTEGSMTETCLSPADAKAELARLTAPVSKQLRSAGMLASLSEVLWAAQAALVALALGGLVAPPASLSVPQAALGFVFVMLLRAGLDAAAQARANRAATTLVAAERARLLTEAARLDARATGLAPAQLASLAGEKLALLGPYVSRFTPAMTRSRIVPIVFLALVAPLSWVVAVIFLIAGPLIPVFMALIGMAAQQASERQMAHLGTLNGTLADRIAASADLRLLGAEDRAGRELSIVFHILRARTMKVLTVAFLSSTVLELFSALGVALVAVYVGFNLLGEITWGSWGTPLHPAGGIFLLMLAPNMFQPMRDLAAAWHDRASAFAVAGELKAAKAMLSEEGQIMGTGAAARALPPAVLSWAGLALRPGPGAAPIALPDGQVAPGEAVAISGPSGAGKSTLIAALAGLIRPDAGEIRWGETVLAEDSADAIRAGMGWLPQAPQFIAAPLSEAITLGRPGDLSAALKAAHAEEIIAALPEGLATPLGDIGGGVSGGEARRLMLARAHHAQAHLILADEPTADLDSETAQAVLAGLMALRAGGAALLIASHDPAVIAAMDRVITLGHDAEDRT
ncbi:ABC transporter ATP-binding protein/permease [Rhodobacter capsulatus]|jgi:ATP-binding cassette subfamily C protein CydD|uniref:Cysteine ABC transporter, permease/ATP-binding protein CydD n=1 Tax=Rhodobacter capsulatus (strain ATCC BAA-309 / NBRC 16581 / SB1003) TaxID=272942 RepID=D5ARH1_RHOCB|nr:ATP-binding cassette domain-containing protein [Rhodobacter capsulatus]ADE86976.1 cysteine ABC transporter, permease/ATP-binding protein CydD [Rhodobacter capsulatus SB 1003]MDS0928774.1 ATP-binding cassette domain-containing protein [Rhodobacter capsulatus]